VFLPGVVVGTHTDGTYDVLIDRASFIGELSEIRGLMNRITDEKKSFQGFPNESKRRLNRVTRSCLSLSVWSSISGNVAPVLLSTLQPRNEEMNATTRERIKNRPTTISLAQRLLSGKVDDNSSSGHGDGNGNGARVKSLRMSNEDVEKTERKTTIALSEIPFFKFLSQTEAVQDDITERHLNGM
jgi:hypothetical protein